MKNNKENMTDSVAFLYIRMKKIMIKQENDARKCEITGLYSQKDKL